MKILITTDWYQPVVNGVVTSVLNLTRGLEQLGHEVRILTLSGTLHSYCEGNVTYIGSVSVGLVYPNARLKTALSIPFVQDIIAWRPDVIHSQCEFSTFFLARKIAKRCGVPLVHTYHTVYEDYTHYFSPNKRIGKKMVALLSRKVLAKTDAVIVPSEKSAAILRRYGVKEAIYTVPTGLDLGRQSNGQAAAAVRSSLGISQDETVFLYVGRLAREKNLEEILHLLSTGGLLHGQSADHGGKNRMLVVGDGPYRVELERAAVENGFGDRVLFTGMISPTKVADYYAAGDIFVTASQSETQGLTYIEAMAAGLPLLCRADPCLDGVIESGSNGFTYTSDEEFMEFAWKLCESPSLREKIGTAAKESVLQRYSIPTFAKSAVRVYESCMGIPFTDLDKNKIHLELG